MIRFAAGTEDIARDSCSCRVSGPLSVVGLRCVDGTTPRVTQISALWADPRGGKWCTAGVTPCAAFVYVSSCPRCVNGVIVRDGTSSN